MHNSRKLVWFFLVMITAGFISCKPREDVRKFAAIESYSEDTILSRILLKKAMIVIAHDDDMCAMAGTASKLNKAGWEIAVISFSKSPERNAAQIEATREILDTAMFVHLKPEQIRNDLHAEMKSYYAIPRSAFDSVFNIDLIKENYLKAIHDFSPEIIFSLDNEFGGYGHAEHVLVSQIVLDLIEEGKISPKYVYQSVYTDHMENSIMERHSRRMKSWGFPGDEWEQAKKVYQVNGMPEPNVQINISGEEELKMKYLRSYNKRERKTLGFFIPEFERYKAKEYFSIFDREFYRIISVAVLEE